MYHLARREGALGGKVSGAGGGGFLLVYCPYEKKHRVAAALEKFGGTVASFGFEPQGLQSWTYPR
jgi:D-glycero-alpha-D-manno-heptose-7-phosphate kinase